MNFGKKLLYTKCYLYKTYVYKLCVLIFYTTLSSLILRRIQLPIAINIHRFSTKVPLILVTFQLNLNFLPRFSKNPQIAKVIKICSVEAELFHAD
jgi:hypothetical protein